MLKLNFIYNDDHHSLIGQINQLSMPDSHHDQSRIIKRSGSEDKIICQILFNMYNV